MRKVLSTMTGLNLIVAIIILNIVPFVYNLGIIDLTKNKIHTLSPASIKIISEIDDLVNIKVYLSSELPSEIKPLSQDLRAILANISGLKGNKIRVSYVDPTGDDKIKAEAEQLGINPVRFSTIRDDKFEVQDSYLGMVVSYGSKQIVLPVAGDIGGLEYFLVSTIKRITNEKRKVVLIADNNFSGETTTSIVRKFLGFDYEIRDVRLDNDDDLGQEADILLIVGPIVTVSDKKTDEIRKWLEMGKGLIVYRGGFGIDETMKATKLGKSKIDDILAEYGMEIEPTLVADQSAAMANFRTANGSFVIQYPYWIQVRPENINNKVPVMSGINSITLPWTSPIKISGETEALFASSKLSISNEKSDDLTPLAKIDFEGKEQKQYVLGAINTKKGKVVLIGNSEMIRDTFGINNRQNFDLALNLVDYFSQDSSLLSIRSKSIQTNPLKTIEKKEKGWVKAFGLSGPVALIILEAAGITLFRKKQNQKWLN